MPHERAGAAAPAASPEVLLEPYFSLKLYYYITILLFFYCNQAFLLLILYYYNTTIITVTSEPPGSFPACQSAGAPEPRALARQSDYYYYCYVPLFIIIYYSLVFF